MSKNNKSGYKGISRSSTTNKWVAGIRFNGKRKHLGTFGSAEEAARVYDKAAKLLHGEFACLNFPG
jgi:hypothetical protein